VPTIKYEMSAFELPDPLDMYLEKSGTLVLLLSPLNGLWKVDEAASRRAGDELTARMPVVVVGRRADRARARDIVWRGAIVFEFLFC
jgi:hypothetical protein